MTKINITENNTKRYGVTFQNNGYVKLQKFEDISEDKNIIYKVNPVEAFVGKIQLCGMTDFSGAEDKEVFNGNTILLEIGKENTKHRYVYIGGDMVCSFLTTDRLYKDISNMGNNLSPYSIATGEEKTYCWLQILNLIKRIGLIIILFWMEYVFQIQI